MTTEDKIYRDLQIHLDEQTVGFPATESGSDIRLLKALFPPDQAEMAMMLTYRYESLHQIKERSEKIGKSIEEVERVLDETAARGMISFREHDGKKQYRSMPLLIGMAEAGAHNPTPEFSAAMEEYFADGTFIQEFLTSAVPALFLKCSVPQLPLVIPRASKLAPPSDGSLQSHLHAKPTEKEKSAATTRGTRNQLQQQHIHITHNLF